MKQKLERLEILIESFIKNELSINSFMRHVQDLGLLALALERLHSLKITVVH